MVFVTIARGRQDHECDLSSCTRCFITGMHIDDVSRGKVGDPHDQKEYGESDSFLCFMVLIKRCFRHFICIEEESDALPPFLLALSESSRHGAGKA